MSGPSATPPSDKYGRGEVYWADFNPARGSEQAGRRPCVIISTPLMGKYFPVVTVASITTKIKDNQTRSIVLLEAGRPLPERSAILTFQIITLDKARLFNHVGCLAPDQLLELEAKLRVVWGL